MLSNYQKKHILVNRDGVEYYTVKGLEEVHQEMLRLLLIIDTIARENNISYWIDGGSLIGIVRHKGFIPWDDDLDISMLKKDYLTLMRKLSEYCKHHDDVALFYEEPLVEHTCNFFASKNLFSRTQGSCTLVPVKVDIRPLNCIVEEDAVLKENAVYRDLANHILFGKSYGYMSAPLANKEQQEEFLKFYNYEYGLEEPGENVVMVHPYFEFSSMFRLTYSDLLPIQYIPFEDTLLPVPHNYSYLLTELYGDYMSFPEICHRAPVACEIYRRDMKDSLYRLCLSLFKRQGSGFWNRFRMIISQIRLIGLFEYIKIKVYE